MANMKKPAARPMSPHLQIWRWHATMASSIFHRVTGVGNIAAVLLLVWWIIAIAAGGETYSCFAKIFQSALGQLVIFALLVSVCYHIANGIRFLFFGLGVGMAKKTATNSAWIVMISGVILALVLMFWGINVGGKL